MWQAILIVIVALVVWLLVMLNPLPAGSVVITWFGWELTSSAIVLSGAAVVLFFIAFALGQIYAWFLRLPHHRFGRKYLKMQHNTADTILNNAAGLVFNTPVTPPTEAELKTLLPMETQAGQMLYLQVAEAAMHDDDMVTAEAYYASLQAFNGTAAVAHYRLAQIAAESGNWQLCDEHLAKLNVIKPLPLPVQLLQIESAQQQQRWQQAFDFIYKLELEAIKEYAFSSDLVGLALELKTKKARKQAEKLVGPRWPLLQAELAAATPAKQRSELLKYWGVESRLDVIQQWYATYTKPQASKIEAQFNKALVQAADPIQAKLCAGWVYQQLDKPREARQALEAVIKETPHQKAYEMLIELTRQTSGPNSDAVRELYQQAVKARRYQEPGAAFERAVKIWRIRYLPTPDSDGSKAT